jgi:hypothetical protein
MGRAKSCGCLHKEIVAKVGAASATHGKSRSRIYVSWCHMISRCYNEKNSRYGDYGGRGISVCDKWKDSFQNFYADMGDMPNSSTLKRRDNFLGYTPENCYWATYTEQNRNRRHSLFVVESGKMIPLAEYAEMKNVSYKIAYQWFRSGDIIVSRPNLVS